MIVDNNDWCCCPSHSSNFLLFWDFLSFPAHRADQFPNSDSDSAVRCSENCWSSVLCMKSWLPNIYIYIILYLHIYLVVINIYMFICANTTILCREIYLYFQHYIYHMCVGVHWSALRRPCSGNSAGATWSWGLYLV